MPVWGLLLIFAVLFFGVLYLVSLRMASSKQLAKTLADFKAEVQAVNQDAEINLESEDRFNKVLDDLENLTTKLKQRKPKE